MVRGWGATRRSEVLLHVCTHAQYTAAQVVNMFRQAGSEKLPDTMLIALARQRVTRSLTPEECNTYFGTGGCPATAVGTPQPR